METISKKVCNFGCHYSFCNPIFASKTVTFGINFLAGNNYPDSHHLHGGMKFATQISPLLNFLASFGNRSLDRLPERYRRCWPPNLGYERCEARFLGNCSSWSRLRKRKISGSYTRSRAVLQISCLNHRDDDNIAIMASLDLSSAFDMVNVDLLLKRMKLMGLPDDLVSLIEIWQKIGPKNSKSLAIAKKEIIKFVTTLPV